MEIEKDYRFDYVFSYWIFTWYVLYEFKIIAYNPKIALVLGLIENLVILLLMFYFANSFIYIFLFCFVNFFLKVLPLWRLRNTGYYRTDLYALIGLFIIYMVWLYINQIDVQKYATDRFHQLKNNKPIGPFTYYVDKYYRGKP